MSNTRIGRRRRLSVVAAALAVTVTAGVATTVAPASAQSTPAQTATWGIRSSYRSYITGPAAHGQIVTSNGAEWTAGSGSGKGPFTWPVTSATYNPTTKIGTVDFGGSVFTGGHNSGKGNLIELSLTDLSLHIEGSTAGLYADITFRPFIGADPNLDPPAEQTLQDTPFATISLAGQNMTPASNGAITITNAPATGVTSTMDAIGWDAFYGSEMPNVALDAFSATFVPSSGQPTLMVSKTTGLNPAGETLTVSGTGFDPNAHVGTRPPLAGKPSGFYVIFGDFDTNWKPSASAPSSARRVISQHWVLPAASRAVLDPDGTDPDFVTLAPDGSFSMQLPVASAGTPTGNYGIYLYAGSGAVDPAQEVAALIGFRARSANESFVTASRTDFIGTSPSPAQVATDVGRVTQVGKPVFLRELSTSDAWLRGIVDRFYTDTMGRPADEAGAQYWIVRIRGGMSVANVAANFYGSAEYFAKYGNNDLSQWITDLYPKLMGRNVDPGGLAYWVGRSQAVGRGKVALDLYQSAETARARVRNQYNTLLGRGPDAGGLNYWAGKVVAEGDLALAVNLANSAEYQNRAVARFP